MPDKRPEGRPSLYRETFPGEAHAQCLLGATDAELAEHFEVATSTIYEWKNAHPEFSESIKAAKRIADAEIAISLRDRARGAEWVEQQAIKVKEVIYDKGKRVSEKESVVVVDVTRRAPPDATSMIFWLKNRNPANWRDKQEIDHTVTDLTPEDRTNRVAAILTQAKERAEKAANGNGKPHG